MGKKEQSLEIIAGEIALPSEPLYVPRIYHTQQFIAALEPRMMIGASDEELILQAQTVRSRNSGSIPVSEIHAYVKKLVSTTLPGETPESPYISIQGPLGSGKTTWIQQEALPLLEKYNLPYTYMDITQGSFHKADQLTALLHKKLPASVRHAAGEPKHIVILDNSNALDWYRVDEIFWSKLIASDALYGKVLWVLISETDTPTIDYDFNRGKAEIFFDRFTMDETSQQTHLKGKKLAFLYNLTHGMQEANEVIAPFLHLMTEKQLSDPLSLRHIAKAIQEMIRTSAYLGRCTGPYQNLFYAASLFEMFDEYTMEAALPAGYPHMFTKRAFDSIHAERLLHQYADTRFIFINEERNFFVCDPSLGSLAQFVMRHLEKRKSISLLTIAIDELKNRMQFESGSKFKKCKQLKSRLETKRDEIRKNIL